MTNTLSLDDTVPETQLTVPPTVPPAVAAPAPRPQSAPRSRGRRVLQAARVVLHWFAEAGQSHIPPPSRLLIGPNGSPVWHHDR